MLLGTAPYLTSLRTACALSPCSVQDAAASRRGALWAAGALCAAHTHTRDHGLTTTHMFIESHFLGQKVAATGTRVSPRTRRSASAASALPRPRREELRYDGALWSLGQIPESKKIRLY